MDNKMGGDAPRLDIIVDDDIATGAYVNLAVVNHTSDEFTLDFIYIPPNSTKAKVRARVISSPAHAKRLLLALSENIRRYEERFGSIDIKRVPPPPPPEGMGHA